MKAYEIVRHKLTGEKGLLLSTEGRAIGAYVQTVPVRMKDYSIQNFEINEIETEVPVEGDAKVFHNGEWIAMPIPYYKEIK